MILRRRRVSLVYHGTHRMKQFACPVCLKTFEREGSCPSCDAELALKAQKIPRDRRRLPAPRVPWTAQSIILLILAILGVLIFVALAVFLIGGFFAMMQA